MSYEDADLTEKKMAGQEMFCFQNIKNRMESYLNQFKKIVESDNLELSV